MKAIALNITDETVALLELPIPSCTHPEDVLVRVLCVGLDGTDREIVKEKYGVAPDGERMLIIGHESLGVVEEAGEQTGLRKGDLVTALVRRPCTDPACINCRSGRSDFCETGRYTERGIKSLHGYLSEYFVERAEYLVKLPPSCISFGVLTEPQSIVEKVWAETTLIQRRLIWKPEHVLILGAGPLGLLAAMTCRCLGFKTYVWSDNEQTGLQADIVQSIGAEYRQAGYDKAGNRLAHSIGLKEFAEEIDAKIDMIWECTGHSPLAFEAMNILGSNGVLAMLGVTAGNRRQDIPVDKINQEMVLKNKCIIGSVNASRIDFETGMDRLRQMERLVPGILDRLITERVDISQAADLDYGSIQIKALVDVLPQDQWNLQLKG